MTMTRMWVAALAVAQVFLAGGACGGEEGPRSGREGRFVLVYEIDVGHVSRRRTESYAVAAREWAIREAGVPEGGVWWKLLGNRRFALDFKESFRKGDEMASHFERALRFEGCDEARRRCVFSLGREALDGVRRDVADAVPRVLQVVRERIAGLEPPGVVVEASGDDIVVRGPLDSLADLERVKRIVADQGTLDFRIVSRERYVDPEVIAFVRDDPRFQGRVSLYTRGTEQHLEAQDAAAQSGRETLESLIAAYREHVGADPAESSLWERVFVGKLEGPRPARGGTDGGPGPAPTAWRTFLLEPEVMVTGDRVVNAAMRYDPEAIKDQIYVILDFDSLGGEQFGDATERNVGNLMAIVLDGIVRSAPLIIEPIKGGSCRITLGAGTPQELASEAADLVIVLKAGALPLPLKQPPAMETRIRSGPGCGSSLRDTGGACLRIRVRQGITAGEIVKALSDAGYARPAAGAEPDGTFWVAVPVASPSPAESEALSEAVRRALEALALPGAPEAPVPGGADAVSAATGAAGAAARPVRVDEVLVDPAGFELSILVDRRLTAGRLREAISPVVFEGRRLEEMIGPVEDPAQRGVESRTAEGLYQYDLELSPAVVLDEPEVTGVSAAVRSAVDAAGLAPAGSLAAVDVLLAPVSLRLIFSVPVDRARLVDAVEGTRWRDVNLFLRCRSSICPTAIDDRERLYGYEVRLRRPGADVAGDLRERLGEGAVVEVLEREWVGPAVGRTRSSPRGSALLHTPVAWVLAGGGILVVALALVYAVRRLNRPCGRG
jgi:hypothetical protein